MIKFLEDFLKTPDINKQIANALIQRYGRGTSKENQKKLAKLVKMISNGLLVHDQENVPQYLVVLVAELCSNDTDNPLHEDSYTMKHVWKAVKAYLEESSEDTFVTAITAIWNGTVLSKEEEEVINNIIRI